MTAGAPAQDGKTCTKCGVWKGLGEFHTDKQMRDGRRSSCRKCNSEKCRKWRGTLKGRQSESIQTAARVRARRWAEENPGRTQARSKQWRAAHPEAWKETYQQGRDLLADRYLKKVLGGGEIPSELVKLKREQLQLHRLLRDFKQVLDDEGETA